MLGKCPVGTISMSEVLTVLTLVEGSVRARQKPVHAFQRQSAKLVVYAPVLMQRGNGM